MELVITFKRTGKEPRDKCAYVLENHEDFWPIAIYGIYLIVSSKSM